MVSTLSNTTNLLANQALSSSENNAYCPLILQKTAYENTYFFPEVRGPGHGGLGILWLTPMVSRILEVSLGGIIALIVVFFSSSPPVLLDGF